MGQRATARVVMDTLLFVRLAQVCVSKVDKPVACGGRRGGCTCVHPRPVNGEGEEEEEGYVQHEVERHGDGGEVKDIILCQLY